MRFALLLLIGCAARVVTKPAPSPTTAARWPLVQVYRLNAADEPQDERVLSPGEALSEEWVARPDEPVTDWPRWLAQMRACGLSSFDFSLVDAVDWSALGNVPLTRLSLAGRKLDAQGLAALLAHQEIRWLDLSQSNVVDSLCAARWPLLQRISLAHTAVGDACVIALSRLPRLERLNVAHTAVTDDGVLALTALAMLSDIVLNRTAVTDRSVAPLLDHFALKRFDANDTGVSAVSKLLRSTSLERLDLGDTRVSPAVVAAVMRHPYLKYLSLAGVGIDAKAVAKLGALFRLEALDITGAKVDSINSLQRLERLRLLSIANTQVHDLGVLASLRGIVYLDVSGSAVTSLAQVEVLQGLRTLDASRTRVRILDPLMHLPLRELHLASASIDDAALHTLPTSLEVLSLSSCTLRDLAALARLVRLRRLSVSAVLFERIAFPSGLELLQANLSALADLSQLPTTLRALHIAHTRVAVFAPLTRLKTLQVLDVTGLPVDTPTIATWQLPKLRVLNASQTRLQKLRGLPVTLETLYINDNDIGDDDLPLHNELPNLERIDVAGTRVTPSGLSSHGF